MEPDETDLKIVEMLKKDSRVSYTEMAKDLGLSDVAVKKRIDKLISNKVIKNFTISLNYKEINKPIRAFLLLKCVPSDSDRIKTHLRENTDILKIIPVIGEYDYLVEVVTRDVEQLRRIAEENIGNIRGVLQVRTLIST